MQELTLIEKDGLIKVYETNNCYIWKWFASG